jgi:hypothetical protein
MTALTDPVAYLTEHYVYEVNMLRWTHAMLAGMPEGFPANALIESFCVHARALMDFYKSNPRGDDVVATHFIQSGQFSANATQQIPPDIRERVNKQIAHLTAGRESPLKKVDTTDRQTLLAAIDADHTAFKSAVDPQYANCFQNERTFAATVIAVGGAPAAATNHVQFLSWTN